MIAIKEEMSGMEQCTWPCLYYSCGCLATQHGQCHGGTCTQQFTRINTSIWALCMSLQKSPHLTCCIL